MPKGCPVTNEQRGRIYHLHTMNVDHKSIAEQFGISVGTVSKCISKQRKLIEGMGDQKVAASLLYDEKKSAALLRKVRKWSQECPDGPRYKACGNSFAVPNVRWLFDRIQAYATMRETPVR